MPRRGPVRPKRSAVARRALLFALAIAALVACASPPPDPPPEVRDHPIGIRVVGGEGEFYDRTTGERFVMRGGNYNRWAWQTGGGGAFTMDMLFNTVDDRLAEAAGDLDAFAAQGYDTLRVWWDGCDVAIGGCSGDLGARWRRRSAR